MQGKDSTDRIAAYVGIDVCKAWLDVCVAADGRRAAWRVANTGAGVRELLRRLGGFEVRRVALEATGRMHLAVFAALAEAGIAVVVLNPYRARKFADALGRLAKTDPIDARLLALAAERLDVAPSRAALARAAPSQGVGGAPAQSRRPPGRARQPARQRRGRLRAAPARRPSSAMIARHLARLEAELRACVDADPALARVYAILVSIPGLGPVSRHRAHRRPARARPRLRQGDRRPGRGRADELGFRRQPRATTHQGRARAAASRPRHGGARSGARQPGPPGLRPAAAGRRQAAPGRPHRRAAKARRARQRPRQGRPSLDAGTGLTETQMAYAPKLGQWRSSHWSWSRSAPRPPAP